MKIIPKSHIGRSPADHTDWVLHRWSCIIGRHSMIGRGGHTLQRWENDASRMCGDINRQPVVYKSAWHLPDVELASGDDLWSRPILCNGRQSAEHRTSASRFQRTSPDDLPTIIGDIGRFHSWLGGVPSRHSVDRCHTDVLDVRAGITRLPVDGSTIETIGRTSEII